MADTQATYSIYLYKYKQNPFGSLTKNVKDLEDTRLTQAEFFSAITDTTAGAELQKAVPALNTETGAPEPLRSALETNLLIQDKQAAVDKFSWLNSHNSDFWKKFNTSLQIDKTALADTIDSITSSSDDAETNTWISRMLLTDPANPETNCVISLDDLRTNLEGIDNGAVITLDYKKLQQLQINIDENDVIEIVSNYQTYSMPTFYGFVTNVQAVEKYSEIVEYKATCAGLGKYLYLSRVILDSGLATQFEQGADIDQTELTPFTNLFNNLNILDIFNTVMHRVLQLDSPYSAHAALESDYSQMSSAITLLNEGISTFGVASVIQDVTYPAYSNMHDDLVKKAEGQGLLALATFLNTTYLSAKTLINYVTILTAERDVLQLKTSAYEDNGKKAPTAMPYALKYDFKLKILKDNKDKFMSFQFSLFLLLLYYKARRLSKYGDLDVLGLTNSELSGKIKDTFAVFYAANTEQYSAFNVMIRNAWERFYSQTTTPSWLLDSIRSITFYEIFEDRPGILTARPPRYNLWIKDAVTDTYIVSRDKVLDFSKTRNDAQLLTRTDYKFMFPYFGTQEFIGGHWLDRDLLYKYGLRADGPKDNPNVTSPTLGHYWSALDMIRANAGTRKATITVPADKEYHLGALYYFENTGVTQQELDAASTNPALKSIGIVGYVTSILTNVSYGTLTTYTLEITYIRKAEYDGDNLNFYHIPDLETFMQYMEKLKSEGIDLNADTAAFQEKVNAEEVSKLQSWGDQEAVEWNGYYYAVEPAQLGAIKKLINNINTHKNTAITSTQEFDQKLRAARLERYACLSSFTVDQFRSKQYPHIYPFVSQELINRLFAVDLCMRQCPVSRAPAVPTVDLPNGQPPTNSDPTFNVLLNPEDRQYNTLRKEKEKTTLKSASYIAPVSGQTTHNAEYSDYLNLGDSVSPSDVSVFLDSYLHEKVYPTNAADKHTAVVGSPTHTIPNYFPGYGKTYSRWYSAGEFYPTTSILQPYFIEVSLISIPDQYKLQFATLAEAGAFVGYKYSPEVDETTRDAHRYGLEVDILPEILQYWKVSDLNALIKMKQARPGTEQWDITVPISQPLNTLNTLSSDDLDAYLKTPYAASALNNFEYWIRKFDMSWELGTGAMKSSVTGKYTTLLPKTNSDGHTTYTYELSDAATYHVQVKHTYANINNTKLLPIPDKRLHMYIDYDTASGEFPTDIAKNYVDYTTVFGTAVASLIGGVAGATVGVAATTGAATAGALALGIAATAVSWPALAAGAILGGAAYLIAGSDITAWGTRLEENAVKTPYKRIRFWWGNK